MKVFISYHRADSLYKDKIVQILQSNHIEYYCVPEDYVFNGLYHQTIAQIIIDNMSDCDVTICIIGRETYMRPHVDHEIKATLRGNSETRRGLVGIMLENRKDSKSGINFSTFPNRIQDNLQYTVLIQMASANSEIVSAVNEAHRRSRNSSYQVNNSRLLLDLRRSRYYDI